MDTKRSERDHFRRLRFGDGMKMFRAFDRQQSVALDATEESWRGLIAAEDHYRRRRGSVVLDHKGRVLESSYPGGWPPRRQEQIYPDDPAAYKKEFDDRREAAKQALQEAKAIVARQARINVALEINRAPTSLCDVLRTLERCGVIDDFVIKSRHAVLGYEVAAKGCVGLNILRDNPPIEFLARRSLSEEELLGVLQFGDKTFDLREGPSPTAVNSAGCVVVMSNLPPGGVIDEEPMLDDEAAPHWGAVEAIVIDRKGYPARMRAIDPRKFARNLWIKSIVDGNTPEGRHALEREFRELCALVFGELQTPIDRANFANLFLRDGDRMLDSFLQALHGG
ncbi:hypothetical protein QM467_15905 [Rhodoblastus sp. 17X3]|uniref:hypothetical protein n=1 Tax=Rhodoblastus sp. 17X3 TaxID=3047026 RepID=UPI0024B6EFDC|nr:hypothetical protein [Rhodoblastus sp. 17X3]MDI9849540.1 hypothetical protein [Rhodoblastus sp. 17X3]